MQEADRGGYLTYDMGKAVFKDRECNNELSIGIVKVDRESYVYKGSIIFGNMEQVITVIPADYFKIEFFDGRGVPNRVFKATYGESEIIKEIYNNKTYIKAYDTDGNLLIKESKYCDKVGNIIFRQMDELISEWTEITKEVYSRLHNDIANINRCELSIDRTSLLDMLSSIVIKRAYITESNVLVIESKHQRLVCWAKDCETVCRVWMDSHVDFGGINVTSKLLHYIKAFNIGKEE